jgi:uncharacterized protein with GYD domain
MSKYMFVCTYSPGSWARLMRISDDRIKAGSSLAESLGGSLETLLWETSARAAYAIAELPDSSTASAGAAVLTHTGAFKAVEVRELLTQDQFNGMLELADDVSDAYEPPGHKLLQDDSQSRLQRRS